MSDVVAPSTELAALDRLVGTWKVTGGAEGMTTYEWMDGKYFLVQRLEMLHGGHLVKGVELIGNLRPFGEEPSEHVHSRFYDSEGNTLDYVYELEGDVLTIWGGEKGSPAYMRATFSADGRTLAGEWVFPGGGGYASSMTRIDSWAFAER